jgi:nitrogen-specific signal transduction histidine kinase
MKQQPTDPGKGSPDVDAANRPLDMVISDAVHELRNGLAGVRGAVQVVREPMPNGMEREILAEVLQRLDHMDRVLLALAAIEINSER